MIDAIEASLARRHAGIYVFPGVPAKVLWRARRLSPRLLAGVIDGFPPPASRTTATQLFNLVSQEVRWSHATAFGERPERAASNAAQRATRSNRGAGLPS